MELRHHGILGQKWGVRNGPPYPLSGGDYTPSQRKAISNKRKSGNSIYNKKHFDEVLKVDKTTLSTLSYDKDRTKNADMFYATHHALDKHQYNALFNRPIPQTVYDKDGKAIGTGSFMKYRIDNFPLPTTRSSGAAFAIYFSFSATTNPAKGIPARLR